MYKIIQDDQIDKYRLVVLENNIIHKCKYNRLKINNEIFPVVPIFDMPGCYAIESSKSHLGEYLEFIWIE